MFDLDAQIVALLKKAETNAAKSKEDLVDGSVINVSADAMKALKSIAKDAETRVSAKKAKEIAA
jgi:predicted membrane-bound spermidine synthase